MRYKECLLFVAKCLTLDHHPERIAEIKEAIAQQKVNWEDVVRLSSGQLVLPALFLQFKRNGLLTELPNELTEYLAEMTKLNRNRNLAILDQAKEVTSILNAHDISPIFLKGTAHLLCGLYTDLAERMIGDIDFLIQEDKITEAADILMKNGYKPITDYNPAMFRELKHYPRLQNFERQAAVEIHKEVMNPPHQKLIRGFEIIKDKQQLTEWQEVAFIPSVQHLIIHNVLNAQLNDKAQVYGDILLRQMYDLWLLSLKADVLKIAKNNGKIFNTFNSYYVAIGYIFSKPKGIKFQPTIRAKFFRKRLDLFLTYPILSGIYRTVFYLSWRIYRNISIPISAIFHKDTRKLLIARLSDRKWYGNHIRSYGLFFKH